MKSFCAPPVSIPPTYGIHDAGRQLADAGCQHESAEIHCGQTRRIADDIKGNKRKQSGNQNALFAVFIKKLLDGQKCALRTQFFHHVSSQDSSNIEAYCGTQHSGRPRQDASLPPSEEVRVGQRNEECRSGAAMDWNTIRKADTSIAHFPYFAMKFLI